MHLLFVKVLETKIFQEKQKKLLLDFDNQSLSYTSLH